MDQNLSLQQQNQTSQRDASFFSCLNCFPQPQYADCYVNQPPVFLKNAKNNNNYLYPSTITQEEKRQSVHSNPYNSMLDSRKSNNNSENKKDAISLRRSRKVNSYQPNSIISQEAPQFAEYVVRGQHIYAPQTLIMSQNSPNLLSSRLSTPQTIMITNRSTLVPQSTKRSYNTRPSIAFSYKVSPQNNSVITSTASKQIKQNVPQSNTFKPTESFIRNSQSSLVKDLQPSNQKLSEIYSKQILQSLQLAPKKISSTSKEGSKLKNGNFGQGRLHFQVRQTISIREPQEEDIHQSIVLSNTQFSHYSGPLNTLLKPITQSELQLQSFIGNNPRNR